MHESQSAGYFYDSTFALKEQVADSCWHAQMEGRECSQFLVVAPSLLPDIIVAHIIRLSSPVAEQRPFMHAHTLRSSSHSIAVVAVLMPIFRIGSFFHFVRCVIRASPSYFVSVRRRRPSAQSTSPSNTFLSFLFVAKVALEHAFIIARRAISMCESLLAFFCAQGTRTSHRGAVQAC